MAGWFAASFVWRKELPPLAGELARLKRRKARQSNDELQFEMQRISVMLGVPIREKKTR